MESIAFSMKKQMDTWILCSFYWKWETWSSAISVHFPHWQEITQCRPQLIICTKNRGINLSSANMHGFISASDKSARRIFAWEMTGEVTCAVLLNTSIGDTLHWGKTGQFVDPSTLRSQIANLEKNHFNYEFFWISIWLFN